MFVGLWRGGWARYVGEGGRGRGEQVGRHGEGVGRGRLMVRRLCWNLPLVLLHLAVWS